MGEFAFDYQTSLDGYIREAFALHALDPEFNRMFEDLLARHDIKWRDPVPTESPEMHTSPPAEGYL